MRLDVILGPDLSLRELTELDLRAERVGLGAVRASNCPHSRDACAAIETIGELLVPALVK